VLSARSAKNGESFTLDYKSNNNNGTGSSSHNGTIVINATGENFAAQSVGKLLNALE
jgi:hypothetical protein